ncbi:MAG: flagellar protein FlaG [Acidobacteria bacterium]|nr:flagellar protein FlaG [Acidobacteriota bacterium]
METASVQSATAFATDAPYTPSEVLVEQRQLIRAVSALNATDLFGADRELSFAVDRESRRIVVRIVDRNTSEVIQEIPPKYVLRMAEDLRHANGSP